MLVRDIAEEVPGWLWTRAQSSSDRFCRDEHSAFPSTAAHHPATRYRGGRSLPRHSSAACHLHRSKCPRNLPAQESSNSRRSRLWTSRIAGRIRGEQSIRMSRDRRRVCFIRNSFCAGIRLVQELRGWPRAIDPLLPRCPYCRGSRLAVKHASCEGSMSCKNATSRSYSCAGFSGRSAPGRASPICEWSCLGEPEYPAKP